MIVPVILSGGAGTRLWPISRVGNPKQLAVLTGTETLIQSTARRLEGLPDLADPIVVCNELHVEPIRRQLRDIGVAPRFIVEPVGRNTAPAAAVAALAAGTDSLLLVLPSDHVIEDVPSLHRAIDVAAGLAEEGLLVTFGVVPDRPETGYGYIHRGDPLDGAFGIAEFAEKPDEPTAESYIDDGGYLWNSGMFMFRSDVYLAALDEHAPALAGGLAAAITAAEVEGDLLRLDGDTFAACPSDSIDYAVMEHVTNGAVVPLDAGWSDVGSWDALWEISEKDGHGNVVSGDALLEGVADSLIRAGDRLVAVLGLQDVVVVDVGDALLVTRKDRSQEVKTLVERLRAAGRPET
jgi:mannose-1-phosphate guanylyltransferase/mannose-6-phosphate isomerase